MANAIFCLLHRRRNLTTLLRRFPKTLITNKHTFSNLTNPSTLTPTKMSRALEKPTSATLPRSVSIIQINGAETLRVRLFTTIDQGASVEELPEPKTPKKRGRKKKATLEQIEDKLADVSEIKENSELSEPQKPSPEDLILLKKLYPQPKNVVHNIYNIVSQELKDPKFTIKPTYFMKTIAKQNYLWQCTYKINWPAPLTITAVSSKKQEASSKAALHLLYLLKINKNITKSNHPILYPDSEASNKNSLNPLLLPSLVLRGMSEIIDTYEKDLLPLLVRDADEGIEDMASENVFAEDKWPDKLRTSTQRFRGLDFYRTKEPVTLPISNYKEKIINAIRDNQVVVIKGEPGCGKSTRVPQYVLEGWAEEAAQPRTDCRIIVTQPRRIAAISLAERVANERQEEVGPIVGYQVRLRSNFSRNSGHIMYCTTGILLRRLQSDPDLSDCSHIILDEAHERDVNTDLLMNLLRSAIIRNPNLKLVVMSATIDAEHFQQYFDEAEIVHIPGFTHPVTVNFLDGSKKLEKTMKMCEGDNPSVVHEDVAKLIHFIHTKREEGAILCFLPGWDDIVKVSRLLPQDLPDLSVLCLHSRLQDSEQRLIFSRPPPGVRKVILTTNIAETSVTVDDVVYVIDTGIQKEKRFDVEKGIQVIDNHWISKASMAQRKGRAGRVKPGESFHLYPESKYKTFIDYSMPEILRTSLTKIVLDCKVYSNNMNANQFLSKLLSPPEDSAISKAVEELKDLELLDEKENLTPLGRVLSDFQLEPKLAKAMVHSVIFQCTTPIIDIVTLFASEMEIFATGLTDKESVNKCKKEFSTTSDHLSLMRLFEKWLEHVEEHDPYMARRFCNEKYLVDHKLGTIQKLRDIHFDYLDKGLQKVLPIADTNSDSDELVKAVLLSGVGTVLQYRNWDIVKGRLKKTNILLTRNNHKATISSESVNFKRNKFPTDFLLYINETRSNVRRTTVVRETSLISPLAVLLFKNNKIVLKDVPKERFSKEIKSDDQVSVQLENTKIEFICDRKQAETLKHCKESINSMVQYYIYQLTKGAENNNELNQIWSEVLSYLTDILNKSGV